MGEGAYKLELPEGLPGVHDVFHVSQLKKCHAEMADIPLRDTVLLEVSGVGCDICQGMAYHVRARLLLKYPGTGMRVARASLPRFGALRRDNTPTPACLSIYIWGVDRAVQSAPRAVSGGSAMGICLHICVHKARFSGRP